MRRPGRQRDVVVVGGGPSGLTVALLLARAGHAVTVLERERCVGGLWSCALDDEGHYRSENSCKVYQSSYRTAPALLRMIGERWQDHFTPRHDLTRDWLRPFVGDASIGDLAKLTASFAGHAIGARDYRDVSVAEYLETHAIGEGCRSWLRATALGGVTGTLAMTMWELFHRLESNLDAIVLGADGVLHWNTRPPNADGGFVTAWNAALARLGVRTETRCDVLRIEELGTEQERVRVVCANERVFEGDAVFLATPPPSLADVIERSAPDIARGFGHERSALASIARESVYAHLGIAWHFDEPLPRDLPLGGHNVRRGWHPILVQHSQYARYLRPPAASVVIGSVSLDTTLRHARLGTLARDHEPMELAKILWDDERRIDWALPEPIETVIHGVSSATQILDHGPLSIRSRAHPIFLATSLNGAAPYFTASLESAIQAGAAAARAFDPRVERLPTGPARRRASTWAHA